MKKKFTLLLIVITICLVGCSSKSNGAQVTITDENKSYLDEYNTSLQNYIGKMNSIMKGYNNAVDGIYTKQISEDQFAKAMKDAIKESNALITEVESIDVDPELFEANQNLILLINRSHQLLLNAIDMVNSENGTLNKDYLRSEYMEIKTQQATLANEWKILKQELEMSEESTQ